jgi:hypothetical protein
MSRGQGSGARVGDLWVGRQGSGARGQSQWSEIRESGVSGEWPEIREIGSQWLGVAEQEVRV